MEGYVKTNLLISRQHIRKGKRKCINILDKIIIIQECKAPCKTMEINSRMLRKVVSVQQGIKILFDPTVRVTRSNPTMTIMTLFSNIGGVVGLTLGYSILQIVQNLDTFIQFCWEKVKQKTVFWKELRSNI